MNGGVLQFSLGLTAGGFLGMLDTVQRRVTHLGSGLLSLPGLGAEIGGVVASLSSMESLIEGVFKAIEKGAALEHLSKRTDTSVASLYALQKGFTAVGLSAEDVGPMIFKMHKSLGGINDMGEETRSVFSQIGISVDRLKRLDAPEQFRRIGVALNHLSANGAASAAGSIFGREAAGNMVQLARSMNDFDAAVAAAGPQAAVFERVAKMFSVIERDLKSINNLVGPFFVGLAEGLAPAIQKIERRIKKIDLSSVGKEVGDVFLGITQAFSEGKFTELLALSIQTGFEIGLAMVPAMFEKLGYTLLKMFETPVLFFQAGVTWVEEKIMEGMGKMFDLLHKIPGGGKLLGNDMNGLHNFKADSFSQIYADRKDEGMKLGVSGFGLSNIADDSKDRMRTAIENMKKISQPLLDMLHGFVKRAPKAHGGDNENEDQFEPAEKLKPVKLEFTSFEKMGFVMDGSASIADQQLKALREIAAGVNRLNGDKNPNTVGSSPWLNAI